MVDMCHLHHVGNTLVVPTNFAALVFLPLRGHARPLKCLFPAWVTTPKLGALGQTSTRYSMSKNVVTLKSGSEVTQGGINR